MQFAVPQTWFAQSKVPNEQIQAHFDSSSTDSDGFAKLVRQKQPTQNDYTLFRDKPLFANAGLYFPIDLSLLFDKFESGPFWQAHNSLQ